MWVKRLYIADDGTEFSDEQACQEYEIRQRANKYQCLQDYIVFYNIVGNPIPYSALLHYSVYYAKVKSTPNWNNEQVVRAWEDIVPEELADQIDCCGTGWYISDGDDHWESWSSYSTEYNNRKEIIDKNS